MARAYEKARLVRNNKLGVDSRADEVIRNPTGPQARLFAKALASWENKLRRSYIEAARFASNDIKEISSVIEVPEEVLETYYYFFFDISEWDRLDKIGHIEETGLKTHGKTEALLKMWTLTQGLDFLAWRLGKKVTISPVEGLVDLFSTCMFRSKEAMFNNAGTDSSAEAIKWSKQSTDIARLLKLWVMDSSQAKKDLEIDIRDVVPEFGGLDALLKEDQEQIRAENNETKLDEGISPSIPDLPDLNNLDGSEDEDNDNDE